MMRGVGGSDRSDAVMCTTGPAAVAVPVSEHCCFCWVVTIEELCCPGCTSWTITRRVFLCLIDAALILELLLCRGGVVCFRPLLFGMSAYVVWLLLEYRYNRRCCSERSADEQTVFESAGKVAVRATLRREMAAGQRRYF